MNPPQKPPQRGSGASVLARKDFCAESLVPPPLRGGKSLGGSLPGVPLRSTGMPGPHSETTQATCRRPSGALLFKSANNGEIIGNYRLRVVVNQLVLWVVVIFRANVWVDLSFHKVERLNEIVSFLSEKFRAVRVVDLLWCQLKFNFSFMKPIFVFLIFLDRGQRS